MLALLLAAQVAAQDTSTYSSDAVRTLVTTAARINRIVPAAISGYRANAESEISFGFRDATGKERALTVEQLASKITWKRTGEFEQRVVGYRTPRIGMASWLGMYRNSWLVPSLYGDRLRMFWDGPAVYDSAAMARHQAEADSGGSPPPVRAVHPLAGDRERYYRYSGGDTIEVFRVDRRRIPIVRINVEPKDSLPHAALVFAGELDLDATRTRLVRVRGTFYRLREGGDVGVARAIGRQLLQAVEFVELVNGEVNGQFWLPQYQRIELQIASPLLGEATEVIRLVSTVTDFQILPRDTIASADIPDSLQPFPRRIAFAGKDTLRAYRGWKTNIGTATSAVGADDFLDVGPTWRRDYGKPHVMLQCERTSDCLHFNRVEGLFVGLGVRARMRDAVPGLAFSIQRGYAISEGDGRGRISAEYARYGWSLGARISHSLDITNDFRNSLDSGSTISAMFGSDDYDYVDRKFWGATFVRAIGTRAARMRLELGRASDNATVNHLDKGLFGSDTFRVNRGIDTGTYTRASVGLEWHPNALLNESAWPGLGVGLYYLRGAGDLNFQRIELNINGRRFAGQWTLGMNIRAGTVLGSPPPQQLFEINGDRDLPGRNYKEFAGDRAVRVTGEASYRLRLWQAPLRLRHGKSGLGLVIPGASPTFRVALSGGWAGASDAEAEAAILRLGFREGRDSTGNTITVPASIPIHRAKTFVSSGLLLFNGFLGMSIGRSLDRGAEWKKRIGLTASF